MLAGEGFMSATATVKMILTPLFSGSAEELIEVEECVRALRTGQFLRSHFKFTEAGILDLENGVYDESKFLAAHPEGMRAFSSTQDNRHPSQQVAALAASEHISPLTTMYRTLGFNVVVTSGRVKTKFNFAFIVPAGHGDRRKTNIPPADVIRGIVLQVPEGKTIGVLFDRDAYPGMRLYAIELSEQEFTDIEAAGGVQLLGDKYFTPVPYTPRSGRHTIFLSTGMSATEAVESDVCDQLAGWLGVSASAIEVSLVPGNVVRIVNPRRPHLGGMTANFTASLPEMQALLGGRLLLPPRVGIDDDGDDEEEDLPSVVPQHLLMRGAGGGASGSGAQG
jgi:hypothetical protein